METIVNTSAIDVLRRLPGVTEGNYRPLMKAAGKHDYRCTSFIQ